MQKSERWWKMPKRRLISCVTCAMEIVINARVLVGNRRELVSRTRSFTDRILSYSRSVKLVVDRLIWRKCLKAMISKPLSS